MNDPTISGCRFLGAWPCSRHRGLRAILEEVLLEVMYELPSRTDVGKCVIDRSVVLDKVNPTLVPRVVEKEARQRRAAS